MEFSVLNWNLQFAGSRKHNFFYDGGDAVGVPKEDVLESLDQIKKVIEKCNPDLLLLQEVDRDSQRTKRIDQLREIIDGTSGLSWISAPYYRATFVPVPLSNPLGRIDLHFSILSHFDLTHAKRTQLALLDEPRWRQMFNLKRGILSSRVPIQGENASLHVYGCSFN